METELLNIESVSSEQKAAALRKAGEIIREGGLVAFPTETVYGLGADALNAEAAAKIYAAKGRPSDNPLIVHIHDISQVYEIAEEVPDEAKAVMEKFWPGPLTIILNKKSCVPDGTTGGLHTVAIRMPSHPIARDFIRESGRMIAAPSANTSGRPSPTLASHVYEDMQGRIPLILDGGAVGIGIESTIIDMTVNPPMVLRPGGLTLEEIAEVLPDVRMDPGLTVQKDVVPKAPGMKYRHYAPKAPMWMALGTPDAQETQIRQGLQEAKGLRRGVLTVDEHCRDYDAEVVLSLGSRRDPEGMAAHLFDALRRFDEEQCEILFTETIASEGIGNAFMNRLRKACGGKTLKGDNHGGTSISD